MLGVLPNANPQSVGFHVAVKYRLKELNGFEREPLRYCKGERKVTFIRPFLMLSKVNLHVL